MLNLEKYIYMHLIIIFYTFFSDRSLPCFTGLKHLLKFPLSGWRLVPFQFKCSPPYGFLSILENLFLYRSFCHKLLLIHLLQRQPQDITFQFSFNISITTWTKTPDFPLSFKIPLKKFSYCDNGFGSWPRKMLLISLAALLLHFCCTTS